MTQYYQMKAKHPDAILLFRVGDFYETFGEDAIKTAKALGITLTARNNGSSKIELAGFPFHALDTYLPKLVRAGYRVAVCDQMEKPDKTKKLVKRGVTEIVTPGVTLNDKILDHRSNNYLAALHVGKKGGVGLALLDISTGEFLVAEGEGDYVDKLLQSFHPSELLLSKKTQKEWAARLGDQFYTYGLEDWVFMEDYTREKLLKQFGTTSLKGFGVEDLELAQVAAGAVLHYVISTENTNLHHINNIARIQPEKYVWLDKFTVRNLELVQSTHASGIALSDIIDKTVSPMGTRLLKKWILLPLKNRKTIETRHEIVRYFLDNRPAAEQAETHIRQMGDLERLISKVPLLKINPREVKQLERALLTIPILREILMQSGFPSLQSIAERLNPCTLIAERIAKEIKEDPPLKFDKGGIIADGVNADLDELRDLILNSQNHLLRIQESEAKKTSIDSLKVGFNSVFGYYLEVTNKYKDKGLIPDHWIRKQTLSNCERYITDELKQLEDKILNAEEKILELEERLFGELVTALSEYIRPVQLNAALVAQLDCLLSFAKVALQQQYCQPRLNDGYAINIKAGRHPVIETQLKLGDAFIPNDVFLDNDNQQVLMITGPNMSGKSALLRQVALICLMAQIGSFVPAEEAELGIIDKIFTRVGASDNISSGESTFMVEMNETASILNNISDRSLILLDEIGRGTSTYDGISIAWAIAEFLHNNTTAQPKTLFATHYHELNDLAERFHRIKNFHVTTKELGNQVIFLRKLAEGGSEHSFGIHVARMAGMPTAVVSRAQEILKQLEEKAIDARGGADTRERLHAMPKETLHAEVYSADPVWLKIKEDLEKLNVNALTPIECMLKLSEWRKMVEG